MGVVEGLSKARMLAIEAASIISGAVNGSGRLILTKHDGSTVDAGYVIGPVGPPGTVVAYAGSAVPSGWLLCDGTEKAIATYPDLYNAVGTLYGALTNGSGGVGSTHFRVPNIKGRVLVGHDSTQTEFDVIGETGGFKTHQLVPSEMPSHNHGGSTANATVTHDHSGHPHRHTTPLTGSNNDNGDHFHGMNHTHASVVVSYAGAAISANFAVSDATGVPNPGVIDTGATAGATASVISGSGGSGAHSHTVQVPGLTQNTQGITQYHTHNIPAMTTNSQINDANTGTNDIVHGHGITSAGGDGYHNNLQPYMAMPYIIKT